MFYNQQDHLVRYRECAVLLFKDTQTIRPSLQRHVSIYTWCPDTLTASPSSKEQQDIRQSPSLPVRTPSPPTCRKFLMAPLILSESAAIPAMPPPSPCSLSCLRDVEGAVAPWTQPAPQQGAADASGWELCLIILEPGRVVTTAGGFDEGQELQETWKIIAVEVLAWRSSKRVLVIPGGIFFGRDVDSLYTAKCAM